MNDVKSRGWLREPLLHFLVIGAVLFGLDAALVARQDDPHTIVMDAGVDAEARRVFQAANGRPPDAGELRALRKVWLDNEVLYREGLAMGLEKGDNSIRERVIFKALSMVDSGIKAPQYDEARLRQWFEQHRARYDQPARYDFQEAVLAGNATEERVRAFAAALNAGVAPDAEAGLRVFTTRPLPTIVQSYGDGFAKQLAALPPGQWHALASRDGWRAVRVQSSTPSEAADFERLRGAVLQDWTDEMMAAQRSAAVDAMAKKYRIKVPG
jgi:hypothetical protein